MRRHRYAVLLPLIAVTLFCSWFAFGQGGAGLQGAPTIANCGSSATCASQQPQQLKIATGTIAFAAATTAGVSGLPAFTATTDYVVTVTDPSNAYTWTVTNTSGSAFTITAGTSNSDTWTWVAVGY